VTRMAGSGRAGGAAGSHSAGDGIRAVEMLLDGKVAGRESLKASAS